jgi:hypothetical protein
MTSRAAARVTQRQHHQHRDVVGLCRRLLPLFETLSEQRTGARL